MKTNISILNLAILVATCALTDLLIQACKTCMALDSARTASSVASADVIQLRDRYSHSYAQDMAWHSFVLSTLGQLKNLKLNIPTLLIKSEI